MYQRNRARFLYIERITKALLIALIYPIDLRHNERVTLIVPSPTPIWTSRGSEMRISTLFTAMFATTLLVKAAAANPTQAWIDGYCHWKIPKDPNWAGEAPGSNWRCLEAYDDHCHYEGRVRLTSGQFKWRPAAIVCDHAKEPVQLED